MFGRVVYSYTYVHSFFLRLWKCQKYRQMLVFVSVLECSPIRCSLVGIFRQTPISVRWWIYLRNCTFFFSLLPQNQIMWNALSSFCTADCAVAAIGNSITEVRRTISNGIKYCTQTTTTSPIITVVYSENHASHTGAASVPLKTTVIKYIYTNT